MTIRYKADYAGTGDLMRSPEMVAVMEAVAERGAALARSMAPERTGEYRASITVTSMRRGGPHGDRAEADIVADSDHAAYVEWRDGYHVLARAAGAVSGA